MYPSHPYHGLMIVENAKMPSAAEKLEIIFYAATYHDEYHSIFPMGDITALIPDEQADVCLLEEPEHLNWYRAPFTAKVRHTPVRTPGLHSRPPYFAPLTPLLLWLPQ